MDCHLKEVCRFPAQQNGDYMAEHVVPWSDMNFTFLKNRGSRSPAPSISGVGGTCGLSDFTAFTTPKRRIDLRDRVLY